MENLNNLNIDFLYAKDPHKNKLDFYSNSNEPIFGLQYYADKKALGQFLSACTLKDFIRFFVKSFKDSYPDYQEIEILVSKESTASTKGNLSIYLEQPLYRKDIENIEWQIITDEKIPYNFWLKSLKLFFTNLEDILKLKKIITDELKTNKFTQTEDTFILSDSPINSIDINESSFTLLLNEDKVIYY